MPDSLCVQFGILYVSEGNLHIAGFYAYGIHLFRGIFYCIDDFRDLIGGHYCGARYCNNGGSDVHR